MKPIYSTASNSTMRFFYSSIHTVFPHPAIFSTRGTPFTRKESASWPYGVCSSRIFSSNLQSECWGNNQEISMMFAHGPRVISMLLGNSIRRRRSRR